MKLALVWLTLHVGWFFLAVGMAMWAAAIWLYFGPQIRRRIWRGRRHSWRVDLAQRQAYTRNKLEKQ